LTNKKIYGIIWSKGVMKVSRPPRILSETGLYHIVFRGLNRQNIFEEDKDYVSQKGTYIILGAG